MVQKESKFSIKMTEFELQKACMTWVALKERQDWRYSTIFAVPNAGKRTLWEQRQRKAEGMKPGVADILVLHPSDKHHFLAIELKTAKGTLTSHQKLFLSRIEKAGGKSAVVRTIDEFMDTLKQYFRDEHD